MRVLVDNGVRPTPEARASRLRSIVRDIGLFSTVLLRPPLRPYQATVARAVLQSIEQRRGLTFTVLMPRQAGKNELSAQLEAFLLTRYQLAGGSIVKAAPTFKPQLINSIDRLKRTLDNPLTRHAWRAERGYIIRLRNASITFFSAEPWANVVGATANLLLECDEAQDVNPEKWDKDFLPMAATGFATRVLYGTPWSQDDLLAQAIAASREAEAKDGLRRHFQISWQEVARHNPLYGQHVQAEIARLGQHHPIIRTQYLLQPLGHQGRFLDPTQLALLRGHHPPESTPTTATRYVAGLDVAGQDEEDPEGLLVRVNPRRDSTALLIARVQDTPVTDLVTEPHFHLVAAHLWRGTPHRQLFPHILALLRDHWRCSAVVIDATGVGGGLAAYLAAALGPRIAAPFLYTAATKSKLAYDLLAAINSGRLKVYAESADQLANQLRRELLQQCEAAEYALRAHQLMSFFVPQQRGHDDLLNALALLAQAATIGRIRTAAGRRRVD